MKDKLIRLCLATVPMLALIIMLNLWAAPRAYAGGTVTNCGNDTELKALIATGGTVNFNCGSQTIPIAGEIVITQNVTIQGGGVITLSGNNTNRVITVASGNLTVNGLGIINGKTDFGAGVYVNGTSSSLTVQNAIFANNQANVNLGNGTSGGAIFVRGSSGLTLIENSLIHNNRTIASGGGVYLQNTNAIIRNSTFRQNVITDPVVSGNDGGGLSVIVFSAGSYSVEISNSTFDQNTAFDEGGGAFFGTLNPASTLNVQMKNTTVSRNVTQNGDGGGLRFEEVGGNGTINVTIENSTISNNQTQRDGGGIGVEARTGSITIRSSTLVKNKALNRGGGVELKGGGGQINFQNSLIALNDTTASTAASGVDCYKFSPVNTIVSQGNNFIRNHDGCGGVFSIGQNDQFGSTSFPRNPVIGPLQNNGGDTETHALLGGSPAIDGVPSANCSATDQRGKNRPDPSGRSTCDIGAYEAPDGLPLVVTNCIDQKQLQALIKAGGYITFGCLGPIPITTTSLLVTDTTNVTIDGGGTMVLQGNFSTRIFDVDGRSVLTLTGITVDGGGLLSQPGGGLRARANSTVNIVGNTVFQNNRASQGGAIAIQDGANLSLNKATLNNNQATGDGGGLRIVDNDNNSSKVTIADSTIQNNRSTSGNGGGIAAIGSFGTPANATGYALTLDNTTITGNNAQKGGGLYATRIGQRDSVIELVNGAQIQNNTATLIGGGVLISTTGQAGTLFTIDTSRVTGNRATNQHGGGIAIDDSFTGSTQVTMNQATVSNNTARLNGGGLFVNRQGTRATNITVNNGSLLDGNDSLNGSGAGVWLQAQGNSNSSKIMLTMNNVTVSNNEATNGNGGGFGLEATDNAVIELAINGSTLATNQAGTSGGGISTSRTGAGTTQINISANTTVRQNRAGHYGGGLRLLSTGSGNSLLVNIQDATLENNRANTANNNSADGVGGGGLSMFASQGAQQQVAVNRTTFTGNRAENNDGAGGAIYFVRRGNGSSVFTATNATFSQNFAGGGGGGAVYSGGGGSGVAKLGFTNSTISSNNTNFNGGGLWIRRGEVTFLNTTLYTNTATVNGGGFRLDNQGDVVMQNTVLAGNVASNAGYDCHVPQTIPQITSNGYNFIGTQGSCRPNNSVFFFNKPGDTFGFGTGSGIKSPSLGPLANNGGSSKTHQPQVGSPLIDAIPSASCVTTTDQRGTSRPRGPQCDIGAVEATSPPKLVITKTGLSAIKMGKRLDYTFKLVNEGSADATNVIVTDTLESGVNFVSASNGGTYNNATRTVLWTLPSVPGETTVQPTLTVSSCQATATNQLYRVAGSDQGVSSAVGPVVTTTLTAPTLTANFDAIPTGLSVLFVDRTVTDGDNTFDYGWNFGDGGRGDRGPNINHTYGVGGLVNVTMTVTDTCGFTATVTKPVDVGGASAEVSLAVSPTVAIPGDTLTYTVTITNSGLEPLTDVDVANLLSDKLTYVNFSLRGSSSKGTLVPPTAGELARSYLITINETIVITYQVKVDEPLADGTLITNSVSISSPELNIERTAFSSINVSSTLRLALEKQAAEIVTPDSLLTYTLMYTVSGNAPATEVTIRDTIPANTTFHASDGQLISDTVVWTVGNVMPTATLSQTGRLTLVVRTDTPLDNRLRIRNTATITSAEQLTATRATASSIISSAHKLEIRKTVTPTDVKVNDILVYTIFYTVTGNQPASNLVVVDPVPTDTTFINATGNPDSSGLATGEPLIWSLGDKTPPFSGTIEMRVRAPSTLTSGQQIINTVSFDSLEQPPAEDVAIASAVAPSLAIEKVANTKSVIAGRNASYSIIVRNTGGVTATGVVITDILPSGFSYVGHETVSVLSATRSLTESPTLNTSNLTWGRWEIAPQGQVMVTFEANISPAVSDGLYDNQAGVTSNQTAPISLVGATVAVAQFPELIVTKSSSQPTVQAGSVATYTVGVRNTGTRIASDVTLTDTLPDGFSFRSLLSIQEVDGNDGSSTQRNNLLNPTLGLTMPVWSSWTIPVGGGFTVTFTVDVSRATPIGTVINTAKAGSSVALAGREPVAEAKIKVLRLPELFINKRTTTPIVAAGELATYLITIQNMGTAPATRVVITDNLPNGFTYEQSRIETVQATRVITNDPTIGEQALRWRGWTLESGGAVTVTFQARVNRFALNTTYNNIAAVTSDETGLLVDDPLTNSEPHTPPDDTAADDDVTVIYNSALIINQMVTPTTVAAGQVLTYEITVGNVGSTNAAGVVISANLPTEFAYQKTVSITEKSALRGTILNPQAVLTTTRQQIRHQTVHEKLRQSPRAGDSTPVWGAWLIAPNGSVKITFLVDVPASTAEGTYPTIARTSGNDLRRIQTQQPISVTRRPVLKIDKDSLTPIVLQREAAIYQIVLRNEGVVSATNVVITDSLPAGGFSYGQTLGITETLATRTAVDNPNPTNNQTPTWGAWTIEPQGSVTVTFDMKLAAFVSDGLYHNDVQADSREGKAVNDFGLTGNDPDAPPGKDSANDEDVTVGEIPFLVISVDTSTPEVRQGGLATYQITLKNHGTVTATNVVITNILPAGFQYVETVQLTETLAVRNETVDPAAGTVTPIWKSWNIARNGQLVIIFTAKVDRLVQLGVYNNVSLAGGNGAHGLPDRKPIDNEDVLVQAVKIQSVYIPFILKQPDGSTPPPITATPPATATTAPGTPTNTPIPSTSTPTPTPEATQIVAPDLIVERLVATTKMVQVVIKNQGNAAVTKDFWVDFYVDPNPPPTQANQLWYTENRSKQGIAWGITSAALPLNPGDLLILTYASEPNAPNLYAIPKYTKFTDTLQAGTPIYVQVDSANEGVEYGAILEIHEIKGEPYNNINLSVLSIANATSFVTTDLPNISRESSPTNLPPRP